MISPAASTIKYLNKVALPRNFEDGNSRICKFKKLEKSLQINFETLLQGITLDADLERTPTLHHFSCDKAEFSILNYTITPFSINSDRFLLAEDKGVLDFKAENCFILIYQTKYHDNIYCLENKTEKSEFAKRRSFIAKQVKETKVNYLFREVTGLGTYPKREILLSQIAFQIADVETFVKTDACMNHLVKSIAQEAALKENPTLIQYQHQLDKKPRFTLLNHTDLKITLNVHQRLFVEGKWIIDISPQDCQVIAYHLEDHPEIACFELQYENERTPGSRFYALQQFEPAKEADCHIDLGT